MAKFMHIKISLMAEITDADALREAALKNFDTADMTSPDHPETADWHASEEGQEQRRQIGPQDRDALNQLADPTKALRLLDGVPGAKVVAVSSSIVGELEGTTRREARDAWLDREGITFLPDEVLAAD
jgi:hypothetical protein